MSIRLTINLPDDVWHRLNAEAASEGRSIGAHLKHLIVKRDERKHGPVSRNAVSNNQQVSDVSDTRK